MYVPYVAHMKPIVVVVNRRKNKNVVCGANNITLHTSRAMATGVKQYPNTHTDWKNDLKLNGVYLLIDCI